MDGSGERVDQLDAHITCYTVSVRTNVTLTVDEELLRAARKAALDRDTSVNRLVRDYLAGLANAPDRYLGAIERLPEISPAGKPRTTGKTSTRNELGARGRESLANELLEIGKRCAAHMDGSGSSRDHATLLYDRRGMPK